jgi:hypothetical protein
MLGLLTLLTLVVSCKKDATVPEDAISADLMAYSLAVAKSSVTGDSIYVVNACDRGSKLETFDFATLPASITSYLTANFATYTGVKAATVKDRSGAIKGYVAIINFNQKPVGIRFDAAGIFVKVLEQREGADMKRGQGWHHGGHFDDRGGKKKDSIALSALPSAITGYLSSNYGQDTLIKAFRNRDSSIVVISTNNGIFATVFDKNGSFITRFKLPAKPGKPITLPEAALPANVISYLINTYPGYVFKHAFKMTGPAGVTNGYVVFIDSNNTKYAVQFDSSGNFVKAVAVR